jgi:hypothetical protein
MSQVVSRRAGSALACIVCLTLGCGEDSSADDPEGGGSGGALATGGGNSGGSSAGSGGSNPGSGGSAGSTASSGGSAGSAAGSGGSAGSAAGTGGIDTTGKDEIWTDANPADGLSCADVCAEAGDECAPVCGDDDDTAVDALYRYVSDNGFAQQQQPSLDYCDEPPPATTTFNGVPDEYTLISMRCCCLTRAVTRVMGDIENRIPCNDVCAAEGMTCHEPTDWGVGTSGMLQTFSPTPTEMRLILGDCDEEPLASVNRNGVEEPLIRYECGCVP